MKPGTVGVRLQALTPGGAAVVGIGVGELYITGQRCNTVGSARLSAVNVGEVVIWAILPAPVSEIKISEGPHCIVVYDPAFFDRTLTPLEGPQSYTIQVTHQ
jgi:hypothetical protein